MKILHIIPYFQPEYGYEEYYSAKWQSKLGHNVFVLTSDRIYPFKDLLKKERLRESGIYKEKYFVLFRLKTIIEFPNELIVVKGIKNTIKKINPDIIHIHGGHSFVSLNAAFAAKILRIPYVVDNHNFDYDSLRHYKSNNKTLYWILTSIKLIQFYAIKIWISRYVFKNAHFIIPVSNACNDYLLKYFSRIKPKIYMIPLGVDHEVYYYSDYWREIIRRRYNIKHGNIITLFVGGFNPYKRFDRILDIIKDLDKITLMVIGSNMYREYPIAKKYEKNKKIIFIGKIPSNELYKYYSAADIALFVFHRSVALFEAMACELPIIIGDYGGEKEFVQDNGYLLINPENELVEKLNHFKHLSEKERRYMGKKSKDIILEKYSYDKLAQEIISVYEKALE